MKRDPVLWTAVAVYASLFFALGYLRYVLHRNFVDLGIFAQTTVSAFGCFCNAVEGSHWAFHFSPVLYLPAALMQIAPSALTLIAIQALAGALTAPPIYGVLQRHTDTRTARLGALTVLLYPPLAGAVFNDFHENGLAAAAVAWLLWAADGRAAVWTAIFGVLAIAVKEDQALFVGIGGVAGALAYRRDRSMRMTCAAIGLLGMLTFLSFFAIVQPHAASLARAGWAPARFYAWTANDWRALVVSGLAQRVGFLLLAFIPLLFIPFRSAAGALAAAPLCEVLFSRMSTTFTTGSHYAGAWAGWVLYAFAVGITRIWNVSPARANLVLYWCIGLCVAEFALANPLHPGYFLRGDLQAGARLDRFTATLPRNISLATQEEAYTHLAARNPNVTVLPESSRAGVRSCFILTDAAFPASARLVESLPLIRTLVSARVYHLTRRQGSISLYMRGPACRAGAEQARLP